MISLDLSQPETCITALNYWLEKVHRCVVEHHRRLAPLESTSQKNALVRYLKHARSTKGSIAAATAEEEEEVEEPPTASAEELFRADCFGAPVVVVGTKADTILADTSTAMKQARELQGRLRSICLEIGAALVYTSAASKDQPNCAALKKYLMHRLYPEQISAELAMEVHIGSFVDGLSHSFFNIQCCSDPLVYGTMMIFHRTRWIPASFPPDSTLQS